MADNQEYKLVVKVAPVIEYSEVEAIGKKVELRLKELDLDNLEATEENKQKLKLIRTELNKEVGEYESARKEIKNAVNDPYKQFEDAYKLHIKSKFDDIDEVEDAQKLEKKSELFDHFLELIENKPQLEFITFDSLGLNITLSASLKSLKDQITGVIEQVEKDLLVIDANENKSRLLVKYHRTRDLAASINELNAELNREKQIDETPNTAAPVVEEQVKDDSNEVIEKISFTLLGATKGKIRNIRRFIESLGVKYE